MYTYLAKYMYMDGSSQTKPHLNVHVTVDGLTIACHIWPILRVLYVSSIHEAEISSSCEETRNR